MTEISVLLHHHWMWSDNEFCERTWFFHECWLEYYDDLCAVHDHRTWLKCWMWRWTWLKWLNKGEFEILWKWLVVMGTRVDWVSGWIDKTCSWTRTNGSWTNWIQFEWFHEQNMRVHEQCSWTRFFMFMNNNCVHEPIGWIQIIWYDKFGRFWLFIEQVFVHEQIHEHNVCSWTNEWTLFMNKFMRLNEQDFCSWTINFVHWCVLYAHEQKSMFMNKNRLFMNI